MVTREQTSTSRGWLAGRLGIEPIHTCDWDDERDFLIFSTDLGISLKGYKIQICPCFNRNNPIPIVNNYISSFCKCVTIDILNPAGLGFCLRSCLRHNVFPYKFKILDE